MHADADGDVEGGDEVGKLLMWLLAEIDAAARGVFTAEDLSVHELRKRARSLSLEMKSDMDGEQVLGLLAPLAQTVHILTQIENSGA